MYPQSFRQLIEELKRLPGIGPKSAQRLAFHLLSVQKEEVEKLVRSILEVKRNIKNCPNCFHISEESPCKICNDQSRDSSLLCVVEEPKDLIAIERSGGYKGLYHVLGGRISPLEGIDPSSLRIEELLGRIQNGIKEVILALNPTAESEATAMYLTKLLKPLGIKVTRIATGLPVGGDLDYTDEITLHMSLEGRREV
jgi:recombination protein RecR